jgi:hypothetical protein
MLVPPLGDMTGSVPSREWYSPPEAEMRDVYAKATFPQEWLRSGRSEV